MLLFNYMLKHFTGKLKTKYLGPFMVSNVYSKGKIKFEYHGSKKFVVNRQILRNYHMGGFGAATIELL